MTYSRLLVFVDRNRQAKQRVRSVFSRAFVSERAAMIRSIQLPGEKITPTKFEWRVRDTFLDGVGNLYMVIPGDRCVRLSPGRWAEENDLIILFDQVIQPVTFVDVELVLRQPGRDRL